MKFRLFLLGFLALSCHADENVNDPEICNVVKKVAHTVMEARQQKVPSQDLQHIANGLEDPKAKQLYQDLINSAYSTKIFKTSFFKRKAIEDFQTGWYEECLNRNEK
ncbi:hypothetical protein [Acinetobacter calcoaceticus]|uniref:hypothetical protein n=1 Tax=Acinetobacter calcoaceticus TaxID=471 RepID=UPI0005EF0E30|nr:hypothetical protein [Acinetobacter calcoaceticus]